ncbi:MAG: acyltransferase [Bacteroidota bacterium]|jgi:peptidoglycan/LPS O-acetylase OafA/YrhL
MQNRVPAIDHLKGFVIALVVLHHAILAYVSFGFFNSEFYLRSTSPIVDVLRWKGFDIIVVFNDGFFMPLMFLLSGLFVWSSLLKKGPVHFLRQRLTRLGVPFAIVVTVFMPIAHYPSFRLTGAHDDFIQYWMRSITDGPWPAGPLWFVWYLLLLNILVACVFSFLTDRQRNAFAIVGDALRNRRKFFTVLFTASLIFFLPMLLIYGSEHWFAAGPFAVQASRVGLYFVYFFAGVGLGASELSIKGVAWHDDLNRNWWKWSLASLVSFIALLYVIITFGVGTAGTPVAKSIIYGFTFALFAATTAHAFLAIFFRFGNRSQSLLDSLGANSYGIYLIHYLFVVWLQYWLLDLQLAAVLKGFIVFWFCLALAWTLVVWLRRSALIRAYV